jgi:hypothetical protein
LLHLDTTVRTLALTHRSRQSININE